MKLFTLHCSTLTWGEPDILEECVAWLVFVRCQETKDNGDSKQMSSQVRIIYGLAWIYSKYGLLNEADPKHSCWQICHCDVLKLPVSTAVCALFREQGRNHSKRAGSASRSLMTSDHVWGCGSYHRAIIGLESAWWISNFTRKGTACDLRPSAFHLSDRWGFKPYFLGS